MGIWVRLSHISISIALLDCTASYVTYRARWNDAGLWQTVHVQFKHGVISLEMHFEHWVNFECSLSMNIPGPSKYSLGVLLTTFKVLVLCVRTVLIVGFSYPKPVHSSIDFRFVHHPLPTPLCTLSYSHRLTPHNPLSIIWSCSLRKSIYCPLGS